MARVKNTTGFIEKAKNIHGSRYNYSSVEYIDSKTKVSILCEDHGIFLQSPNNHLSGKGCKGCAIAKTTKERKKTKEVFIEQAGKIHGDIYNYSLVEYKNANTKVKIICGDHGEFFQKPSHHLSGHGCRKCSYDVISNTHSKEWTQKEEEWLIKNHKKETALSCCEYLNVCLKTLRKQTRKLDLKLYTIKNPNEFHHTIQKFYWRSIKRGAETRNLQFNISIDYVWSVFISQKKKCALSGVDIAFGNKKETTASIDRIDSKKGYTEGNIQIVHKRVNMMKMSMKDQDFIKWCKLVANFNK